MCILIIVLAVGRWRPGKTQGPSASLGMTLWGRMTVRNGVGWAARSGRIILESHCLIGSSVFKPNLS
jgi:hypothetical protein